MVAHKPQEIGKTMWKTTDKDVPVLYHTIFYGPCNEAISRKFGMACAAVRDKNWADKVICNLNDCVYVPLRPLLCLLP